MSIRINNQTIAGNYEHKPTSYRYVGEIFQSAIPITDEKVACLDGHKIYSDEGYGSFIQHLISQSLLYPQLVCTEEVWQEKVIQYGSWGQFVIDTQENSVRLPKIAGFVQGLNTLEDLAGLLEAGLPNIEGEWTPYVGGTNTGQGWDVNNVSISGAFGRTTTTSAKTSTNTTGTYSSAGLTFNASLSDPIYGNSNTVQPQAIQYPYYIVLATGVVQEINVKKEVELNNPFFFGMYQYFETNPNNVSWLKSEGQWNNGSIYEGFYEWLVNSYNDTESGVSVKSYSDTYTNFDYVLNQDDKTFRLPIEVKQKFYNDLTGDIPVAGNGMTLGLTDGTNLGGTISFNYTATSGQYIAYRGTAYGSNVGTSANSNDFPNSNTKALGVTTDPTKSGIEAQITQTEVEGLGLYFYVGDTVQNANLVNVGRIEEKVASLIPDNSSVIANYAMPSNKYIDLTLGASGTTYTAPANGYVVWGHNITANNQYIELTLSNGMKSRYIGSGTWLLWIWLPVKKGEIYSTIYTAGGVLSRFRFIYAEGEQ